MAPVNIIMLSTCGHPKRLRLTDDSSPNLREEHDPRWNLKVLPHLQISCKPDGGRNNIVTPHRELCELVSIVLVRTK